MSELDTAFLSHCFVHTVNIEMKTGVFDWQVTRQPSRMPAISATL